MITYPNIPQYPKIAENHNAIKPNPGPLNRAISTAADQDDPIKYLFQFETKIPVYRFDGERYDIFNHYVRDTYEVENTRSLVYDDTLEIMKDRFIKQCLIIFKFFKVPEHVTLEQLCDSTGIHRLEFICSTNDRLLLTMKLFTK